MTKANSQELISVVLPCLNEEKNIRKIYEKLVKVSLKLKNYVFEFIFVNDGSKDNTEKEIIKLNKKDNRVKLISFSRNFGHQIAISAGIDYAQGSAVIIMDADLQHPPEIIPSLIKKYEQGYDIVYTVRKLRQGESRFKLWTAELFYRLIKRISEIEIPYNSGDFRLINRKVAEVLKKIRERNRFLRGLNAWVGFKQTAVYYVSHPRQYGETKYSLLKMIKLALDAITSFSSLPLKIVSSLGLIFVLVSFLLVAYALVAKIYFKNTIPGWASLFILFSFFTGIQFTILGIYGEYIARIYEEVKKRPLYIIDKTIGF